MFSDMYLVVLKSGQSFGFYCVSERFTFFLLRWSTPHTKMQVFDTFINLLH